MIKKVLLAASCLLLLVGCVLLVVFLRGGDTEEPEVGEPAEPLSLPVAAPAPAPVEEPAVEVKKPAPRPAPRPAPARLVTLPPAWAAPSAPVAPGTLNLARRPVAQVEVTKMLKLTPPRMDPKRLNEQTQQLADALAEAKRKGSWSRERIKLVEAQLKGLRLNQLQHRLQKGKAAEPPLPPPPRRVEPRPQPPPKHEDESDRPHPEPRAPKHHPEPRHHPEPEDEGETDRPE